MPNIFKIVLKYDIALNYKFRHLHNFSKTRRMQKNDIWYAKL